MATSCGGGATQRYSLSTRQADGALSYSLVAVEEDTAAVVMMILLLFLQKQNLECKTPPYEPRSQELQSSHSLLVGEEEKQK